MRLNNLNIKENVRPRLSQFVIYIKAITFLLWHFVNFIVVAVFVNCLLQLIRNNTITVTTHAIILGKIQYQIKF